ncbi:MAG TPA: hypothetical protein ENH43_03245 [Phycisphaerales bacterium]|nr:hypothetical protein [Phycisphaerales bacterium]
MATLFGVWVISWVFVWCELTTPGSELMMLVLGFTGTIAIAKVQKLTEKLEAAEKQKKIYESGFAKNVFQQLDTECSLCVLGLCLASHDIVLHHSLIDKSEAGEKNYHFAASLSILREIAKMVEPIEKLAFTTRFSQETKDLLQDLKRDLQPFQDNSLIYGTLKPIRNFTFHYDFTKADKKGTLKTSSLLAEIKKEHELKVRAISGDNSIFRYRYTFADAFRSKLIESYLTKDLVDKITVAVMNVIAFTDSLLADLSG